jgi:hypothetical protein
MSTKKTILLVALLVIFAMVISACKPGEAGPTGSTGDTGAAGAAGDAGPAGADADVSDLTCTECHDSTSLISGKQATTALSGHQTGTAAAYAGARGSCTGCHSGGSFSAAYAGGMINTDYDVADPNPSPQDCRTCHQIHTTYTGADWALTTTAAVELIAFEGVTFDGGKGNLCASCHQPRRSMESYPADEDGNVEISSTHWGPHHGPQSAILMGTGGAMFEGSLAGHATMVEDTCVTCHLGEEEGHTFAPQESACVGCHGEDFDFSVLQDEVSALGETLLALLEEAGSYHDGHPVVGNYAESVTQATWVYITVFAEDGSLGVHNPKYITGMLNAAIASFEAAE